MEYEDFLTKRKLGDGRWDKMLKKNLVERSNADNYDPAATFGINSEQCRYKNPITLEDLTNPDKN